MTDLWLISVAHPAWIIRGMFHHEPAQIEFLRRAWAIASGGEPPYTNENTSKRALGLWGCAPDDFRLHQVATYFTQTRHEGYGVDIEAAGDHLTYLGFCSLETQQGLGIRFRREGGAQAWTNGEEFKLLVELLYDVLADPDVALWFHNGPNYDVPALERIGFQIRGLAGDTMLLATACYSELPRRLEFLATLYCGIPMWKYLVKDKDLGETK